MNQLIQIILGKEAVDYFNKSGLSNEELANIWEIATSNSYDDTGIKKKGLSPHDFSVALNLIRKTQLGMHLSVSSMFADDNLPDVKGSVASFFGIDLENKELLRTLASNTGQSFFLS